MPMVMPVGSGGGGLDPSVFDITSAVQTSTFNQDTWHIGTGTYSDGFTLLQISTVSQDDNTGGFTSPFTKRMAWASNSSTTSGTIPLIQQANGGYHVGKSYHALHPLWFPPGYGINHGRDNPTSFHSFSLQSLIVPGTQPAGVPSILDLSYQWNFGVCTAGSNGSIIYGWQGSGAVTTTAGTDYYGAKVQTTGSVDVIDLYQPATNWTTSNLGNYECYQGGGVPFFLPNGYKIVNTSMILWKDL